MAGKNRLVLCRAGRLRLNELFVKENGMVIVWLILLIEINFQVFL